MALTRIYNNQITDATIYANAKIVPGSIVGSLFNSNLTFTSDVTITGNLTVLGNNKVTSIASTNTFVNDPLITLNNGFAGTNTYDEGLVFNRGTSTNQAFIWSEVFKEFRVISTTETGTTYGNVNATGLANLTVGNFISTGISTFANLITGTIIASSANISTAYHNTLNVTGNVLLGLTQAAAINNTPIGNAIASSGAFTTLFANSQVTFSANTASTNSSTGALVVNGGVGIGGNLFIGGNLNVIGNNYVISSNSGVFYGNAVGAGALYAGVVGYVAQPFTTIQTSGNANNYIQLNLQNINGGASASGDIVVTMDTGNATVGYIDMGINSSGFVGGAGNELNYPGDGYLYVQGNAVTGSGNLLISTDLANDIVFSLNGQGSANEIARFNYAQNALLIKSTTAATNTTSGALQVAGGAGIAGNLVVGGNIQAAGAVGLSSTLSIAGIASITNTTNATAISGSGALQVAGGASFTKDVWIGGNLFVSNIIGVTANIITVTDPLLYLRNSNVSAYNYDIGFYSAFTGTGLGTINQYQHTSVFRDPLDNTWKFVSNLAEPSASYITLDGTTVYDPIKAGNLQLTVTTDSTSATTGALIVAGGVGIGGNIFQTGAYHQTSASNYIFATTPTSVNAFTSATTFNIGGSSGALTINNPTVVGTSITNYLYDTNTLTMYFARSGNVTMNTPTGTTTLQGNAVIGSVTQSTNYTTGALTVAGGVGINGNLNLSRNNVITIGADLASNVVYPESVAQFTSNSNIRSRISLQNISTGTNARAEFTVYQTSGSNTSGYISTGLNGSSFQPTGITNANDAYTIVSNGNYYVSTQNFGKNIYIAPGGSSNIANIVAVFDGTNSNLTVSATNAATSTTTGALTVLGGVGIGGNLYVSGSNGTRSLVLLNSQNTVGAFYNPSGQSLVVNGGSYAGNVTQISGASFAVRATDTLLLPVGTTAQRPSSTGNIDLVGMIRYSTTTGTIEWCTTAGNPGTWTGPGVSSTVIYDQQFNGDGSTTQFAVNNASTTNSTVVSINGVVQAPVIAYAMSDGNLQFTEAPAVGDLIDVRTLTATTTISSLSSANGFCVFDVSSASNTYANVVAGTDSAKVRISVQANGIANFVNNTAVGVSNPSLNAPTAGIAILLDTWAQTAWTSARYALNAKVGSTNMEAYDATVLTDGSANAYIAVYGVVNNGTTFGTLSANVVSGNVNVYFTSTIAQANVRIFATYIQ